MFERRTLSGSWLGIPLPGVLRSALIENQLDARLQDVWFSMLEGRPHEFLGGNEYAGFEGVLPMPASRETRGQPALDALGQALRLMAERLKVEHDRRPRFRRLVERALATYPGRARWPQEMIAEANKHNWPEWALDCIELFVALPGTDEKGRRTFLLWRPAFEVISVAVQCLVVRTFCRDNVLEVKLPAEQEPFARQVALPLEDARRNVPYPSERAVAGATNDMIAQIELSMPRKPNVAKKIAKKRKRALLAMGISLGRSGAGSGSPE
jgi:hypothetical protein